MPLMRRVGRPGLIGMAARTAVVAGTATAVSGNVARRQQRRANEEYEEQQHAAQPQQEQYDRQRRDEHERQQYEQAHAEPVAAMSTASAGPVSADDLTASLERLAALRQQGVLSDAEFAAAKSKLLG